MTHSVTLSVSDGIIFLGWIIEPTHEQETYKHVLEHLFLYLLKIKVISFPK